MLVSCCYLAYNESSELMPNLVSGFGLLNNLVIFPLPQYFALIGSYYPLPTFRRVDYITVQAMNWVTAFRAEYILPPRQYSPLPGVVNLFLIRNRD